MEAINQERVLVRSSNQEQFYSVNTVLNECDCKDFPHIGLCKHLAAMWHYSGGGKHSAPTTQLCPTAPDLHHTQESGNAASQENATASLISAVNEIITLSQQLVAQALRGATLEMVKSVCAVCSHLSVVASATGDGQQLPEKEAITLSQLSWPETAECIGVKWGEKCHSKVDSTLTAELISEPNHKQNHGDEDPYGTGEQSGKHAKPDACSVTTNTQVWAAVGLAPVHSAVPLASLPTPTCVLMHTPMHAPHYAPAPPLSLSQPTPSSFSYRPQPYLQYPSYFVPSTPMYYPPPT